MIIAKTFVISDRFFEFYFSSEFKVSSPFNGSVNKIIPIIFWRLKIINFSNFLCSRLKNLAILNHLPCSVLKLKEEQYLSIGIITLLYFSANKIVPLIISKAPSMVFKVSVSLKNNTARMIAMATLSLSTAATCDTFPICKALK